MLPTKLGVTATSRDEKVKGGSRWLSIVGRPPHAVINSFYSHPLSMFHNWYRPTISPGETLRIGIQIENHPSFRTWTIQASCAYCGPTQQSPNFPASAEVDVTLPANYWDQVTDVRRGRVLRIEVNASSESGVTPFAFIQNVFMNIETGQGIPPEN